MAAHETSQTAATAKRPADHESTFDRAKPIALGLVLAVLAVAGLRVLVQLEHVLILVFVAILVASALSRPAAVLERRGVPLGVAVAIVQLAACWSCSAWPGSSCRWSPASPLMDRAMNREVRASRLVERGRLLSLSLPCIRPSAPTGTRASQQVRPGVSRHLCRYPRGGGNRIDVEQHSAELVRDLARRPSSRNGDRHR